MQFAKTLAAIDVLSEGRLIVGVGPGSSAADYAAVGVPFDEAQALRRALSVLRPLLEGDGAASRRVLLHPESSQRPRPAQPPRPIWVGSWGSPSRACDWSRITATAGSPRPATRRQICSRRSRQHLRQASARGTDPESFTNAIATAWLYITENTKRAESVLTDIPRTDAETTGRGAARPLVADRSTELCAERLSLFASSGAQRIFLWPLGDELEQLELFREQVAPCVLVDRP